MPTLPPELAPALRTRRRAIAASAKGTVLDLGGWRDHLDAYRVGDGVDEVTLLDRSGGEPGPAGITAVDASVDALAKLGVGPFDTVVSLARTPLVDDLGAFLDAVISVLASEGHVHVLEPVCRSGRAGRLLALGGRMGRAAGGLHLDRDIPAALREAGLVVTDLDRFEVPTLSAPLRPWVQARARRPAGRSDPVIPPGPSPTRP